jgi:hypothetical protein
MEKRYIPGGSDAGVYNPSREDSRKRRGEEIPGLIPGTMTREDKDVFFEVIRDWLHEQRSAGTDRKK